MFKVGDRIRRKNGYYVVEIIKVTEDGYYNFKDDNNEISCFNIEHQDKYELVPNKFDITTLKPFAEVLVRNSDKGRWVGQFYTIYDVREEYPFECVYNCWKYCIPYKGNEHLLDKTDDCDDFYKIWEE